MKNGQKWELKKKAYKIEAQPHVIPEVENPQRNDIRMNKNGLNKYNTRSRTNRVNHVTTAPNMFKMGAAEKWQHT